MGLVLNVEIVTPYASFLVVAITNVYFCYAKLQRNYMEVKEFIKIQAARIRFDQWY